MTDRTMETHLEPGGRAAEKVAASLTEKIVAGDLADGARLPSERDLIDEFGVSRTVVREAIAMLANRGLVENRPRFRPVVRRPGYDTAISAVAGVATHLLSTQSGVRTLFDVRIFVEAGLVREAALNARRSDIAALEEALAANEAAIGDSHLFYATDVAFHAVLYEVPGNPIFPAIHGAFTDWLSRHWERMPRSAERNRVNFLRHRDIAEGIVARDPDAAEAALRAHLNAAWEFVRGTFEDA
ncbi:MAG: FCD domain-containing protein [Pseudomonadota bacterium]